MSTLSKITNIFQDRGTFPIAICSDQVLNCANKFYNSSLISEEIINKEFKLIKPSLMKPPSEPNFSKEPDFEYKQVKINKFSLGKCLVLFIIGVHIAVVIFAFSSAPKEAFLPIFITLSAISLIISIWLSFRKETVDKKLPVSEQTKKRFEELNKKAIIDHKKLLSISEANNVKYKDAIAEYELKIYHYRNKYLLIKHLESIKPDSSPMRTQENVNKGSTEMSFLIELLKWFHDDIKIDMKLGPYFPDFVFECKNPNFFIDIEIDEDYDFVNHKPLHFKGEDDSRNKYFLSQNWFVIRFAEQQILDYPAQCCKYLKDVIEILKDPLQSKDLNMASLPQIRQWTYEEAAINGKNVHRVYER